MNSLKKQISGWGNYPRAECLLNRPESLRDLQNANAPRIGRGYGRCYGDAAQLTDGYVVQTERLNRILAFDPLTGIVRAEAGVSFKDLLDTFVPRGWFPPVTPGTKWVTLGGCVAADVHGKNHHVDGSFGRHVIGIELITPEGGRTRCSPTQDAQLFWATVGGMGLTGIISEVTLRLIPIPSAYIAAKNTPASNLDELFHLLSDPSKDDMYSVAWVDCMAGGKEAGRGVVMNGHHAALNELTGIQKHPFCIKKSKPMRMPFYFSSVLLSRRTIAKANRLYYTYNGSKTEGYVVDYDKYFYPLDVIDDWNRVYGKKGFIQYQFVTPPETSKEACRRVLKALADADYNPYLAVLKRFGPEGQGYLSFPREGFTLALDIPIRDGKLFPLLDRLDDIILQHGGRIYLAKDARMAASTFKRMYPRLEAWLQVKRKIDGDDRITSDLAKRLQL